MSHSIKLVWNFCFLLFAVLIAEVTQVSLGVGYEIGRAVAMNKSILCLYRPMQSDKSNGDSYYAEAPPTHLAGPNNMVFLAPT